MAINTCLIHIGTHKTGTTSFQALIAGNPGHFRSQGLYYPMAGRNYPFAGRLFSSESSRGWVNYSYGHHKLAWELGGHRRESWPQVRSLAKLMEELARRQPSSVLLSSEILECLFRRPDALLLIRDTLEALGYASRVVVTLRDPADYAQSLYTELATWHGWTDGIDGFVRRVLLDGVIAFREWDFCFDFSRLTAAFADVFGERNVHTLLYNPNDSVGPLLTACGTLLGLSLRPVPNLKRLNTREPNDRRRAIVGRLTNFRRTSRANRQLGTPRQVLLPSHREALVGMFKKTLDDAMMKYGT